MTTETCRYCGGAIRYVDDAHVFDGQDGYWRHFVLPAVPHVAAPAFGGDQ